MHYSEYMKAIRERNAESRRLEELYKERNIKNSTL